MNPKRLVPGRPVWALTMDDSGATVIAAGVITSCHRNDRREDMRLVVRYLRPVRGRDTSTYRRSFGYVIERTEPTYNADDQCIDCREHLAGPHSPVCPFSD